MSDSIDCELIALINRLNKIQKEIGGGKKDKGAHDIGGLFYIYSITIIIISVIEIYYINTFLELYCNSFYEGDGKIDRFVDLSSQVTERIQIVKDTIEDIRKLEKSSWD